MIVWLMNLLAFAQPQARCTDLPRLYTKGYKSPLSKVYNPTLYALRNIPWSDWETAGVQKDSVLEVGSDWIYWSHVSSLDVVEFVQSYLWPNAVLIDRGDQYVMETNSGRWMGKRFEKGLLIAKINARREAFPDYWARNASGCSVSMTSVQLPFVHVEPPKGVELSFAHEREIARVVFPNSSPVPRLFKRKSLGKWTPIKTIQIPSVALVAGEEPISILDAEILSLPKLPDQVQQLDKKLHLSPGTQVGLFGDDAVFSAPLQGWFGCPLPRWQIEWGLRSGEKIAPHRFQFTQDGEALFVEAQRGRVVASSSNELLNDVLSMEGTSWFSSPSDYESEHILARINIPPSMYMFVGPLEYVELSLSIQDSNWNIEFIPFTQSKVRAHQLFLTYFATLQKWDNTKKESIPPSVEQTLKRVAAFAYTGERMDPETNKGVWLEEDRVFLEDEDQRVWVYDPLFGIRSCDKDMTESCGSVK